MLNSTRKINMNNPFKYIVLLLLLTTGQFAFAQADTAKEKAQMMATQAILFEGQGKIAEAIPLLEGAKKLDSGNINYPYELAVIYYTRKDYAKAQQILEPLLNHKDVSGMIYQVLGNVYDDLGKTDLAVSTYEKGLKLFPKTAELYLEMGIIQLKKKEYNMALQYFEKGIVANPIYASNYYRATKLFCNSSEPVWGVIYGEIFMNLERNSDRTAEISKLLVDTYKNHIRFPRDSSFSVSFSTTVSIFADKNVKPFAKACYEPTVMMSMLSEKKVDVNALCRMRKKFIESYIRSGNYQQYPNALFSYQYKVLKAGHMDAYNHWILQEGDKAVYNSWLDNNKDAWDKFLKWYKKNPLLLDDNFKFYRAQY